MSKFGFIWKSGRAWLAEICTHADGGGRQLSETFTSKAAAKTWLAQHQATPWNY